MWKDAGCFSHPFFVQKAPEGNVDLQSGRNLFL